MTIENAKKLAADAAEINIEQLRCVDVLPNSILFHAAGLAVVIVRWDDWNTTVEVGR